MWEQREHREAWDGLPHDQHNFDLHLIWLHRSSRTQIKPPYTNKAIEEDSNDDGIADAYDDITRAETQPKRGPLQSYVVLHIYYLV
jgi:hypothetical protein